MYFCQDTGKNVDSLALRLVLRHTPFFFGQFVGYFLSIWPTFARIQAKTLVRRLWNRLLVIHCSFLNILVVILRQFDVPLPRYRQKCWFAGFETEFTAYAVLFWALWWYFCINRTYHCQDMDATILLAPLKPFLPNFLKFFCTLVIILC